MRGALVFALCFALVTPATAAPFTAEMDFAYRLALRHWGAQPNCLSIDFEIADELAEGELGEATIPLAGEPPISCHMYLIRELAPPRMFERMCAIVFHETGHLEGLGHSDNPKAIMYPYIDFVPSTCAHAGLWLMNHPNAFGPPS